MKPLLLQAFEGTNKQVPVWFMRQAGRFLPEYQAFKAKYSLQEMFTTPDVAADITCLPVDILGVDAAILFADILTLPMAMGFDIHFDNKRGPQIQTKKDLTDVRDIEEIEHVTQTIKLINQKLPEHIPLIGFAGSPFTVLTYLIEGGSSVNFTKTLCFIAQEQESFHQLMDQLTRNTITYLNQQKQAGIKVFQIFDTWAHILRPADYAHFVLPYIQKIFNAVDLPSIYFAKHSNFLLPLMDQCGSDFLSVDQTVVLGHHSVIERTKKGIQGNLFNGLLYADKETLKREVNDVLVGAQKHDRYIFNLSHGIFPDIEVDKVKYVVEEVHAFAWHN